LSARVIASLTALLAAVSLASAALADAPARTRALPTIAQEGGRCDELAPGAERPLLGVRASAAGSGAARVRVSGFLHPCSPEPDLQPRWLASPTTRYLGLVPRPPPSGAASACDCAHAFTLRLAGLGPGALRIRVTDGAGRTADTTVTVR
jgi:hypothetical protein